MNTRAVIPTISIRGGKLDFDGITVTEEWPKEVNEMVDVLGAFGELLVHDVVIPHSSISSDSNALFASYMHTKAIDAPKRPRACAVLCPTLPPP